MAKNTRSPANAIPVPATPAHPPHLFASTTHDVFLFFLFHMKRQVRGRRGGRFNR